MIEWNFKTLPLNPRGSTELIDLSPVQQGKIPQYVRALQVGVNSTVANPTFSNYFVKGSIFPTVNGLTAMESGNIEYGLCQALHGSLCACGPIGLSRSGLCRM